MSGSTIPVVDVSALSLENKDFDLENICHGEDLQRLGSRLVSALQQNGFVYIAGHGVDQQPVQQVGPRLNKLVFFSVNILHKNICCAYFLSK